MISTGNAKFETPPKFEPRPVSGLPGFEACPRKLVNDSARWWSEWTWKVVRVLSSIRCTASDTCAFEMWYIHYIWFSVKAREQADWGTLTFVDLLAPTLNLNLLPAMQTPLALVISGYKPHLGLCFSSSMSILVSYGCFFFLFSFHSLAVRFLLKEKLVKLCRCTHSILACVVVFSIPSFLSSLSKL